MSDQQTTTAEPEITEATIHEAAEHIAKVAVMPYSAAECQARLMTDEERVTACKIKTGNDMKSHFFDVSQRIAKADRVEPEPTSLVIEEPAAAAEVEPESEPEAEPTVDETPAATIDEEPAPAPKKKRK